jgi:hypothetical protein
MNGPFIGILHDRPKILAHQGLAARDGQKRHASRSQLISHADSFAQEEFASLRLVGSVLITMLAVQVACARDIPDGEKRRHKPLGTSQAVAGDAAGRQGEGAHGRMVMKQLGFCRFLIRSQAAQAQIDQQMRKRPPQPVI